MPAASLQDDPSRWSLTDLLSRASHDDDPAGGGTSRPAPLINLDGIARALDPNTASAIWSRYRSGQQGIMARSIYTNEGRATFDEISERYRGDGDFRRTVDRFLADFESIVKDMEMKDPTGRVVQNHLVSDSGRVYLFLAHASGRMS